MCNVLFLEPAARSTPDEGSIAANLVDAQSVASPPRSIEIDFFEISLEDALAHPSEVLCLKPGERCVDTVPSGVFQLIPAVRKPALTECLVLKRPLRGLFYI